MNSTEAQPAERSPCVLVADDGEGTRRVAVALLGRAGCRVDAVADGRAALEAARAGDYALVLLDLEMPELDGARVAAAIRRLPGPRGRVPLVAITATPRTELRIDLRDFDGCLPKPLGVAVLRGAVERWVGPLPATKPPQRAPVPGGDGTLHPTALERMRSDVGSEALGEVLDAFTREIEVQLDALEVALRRRSLAGLERCAHRLRANAGSVGAESLQERAAELEAAARSRSWERARALALETQPLGRAVLQALAQLEKRLGVC